MKKASYPSYIRASAEPEHARFLGERLGLRSLIGQLLLNRGIRTEEAAKQFLSPQLSHLRPPEGDAPMAHFSTAVERIRLAVLRRETIGVFGDYDVDGVTTCALLTDFLRQLGAPVVPRVARRNEGYGFGVSDARSFVGDGCSLVITGDCGTSDHDSLQFCREHRMDVVIVDHHQVPDRPPDALALLNPHQPGCLFPFKGLASVGVAFYLAAALRTRLKAEGFSPIPELRRFLDLVALGTVADLAPLLEENRILVSAGLRELKRTRRVGLQALARHAGLPKGASSAADIAFRLAPRLNAPGRLGNSEDALGVLLEQDVMRAVRFADACHSLNLERQQIQKSVFEEARAQAEEQAHSHLSEVLVIAGEGWHSGVVGIVASKLVEEYGRPAVVVALEGEYGRGSARTVGGFHIYQGLKEASELLQRFGGHAAAAGLVVAKENVPVLRERLCEAYRKQRGAASLMRTVHVDAELEFSQLDAELLDQIHTLEPFGMGNPEPLFLVSDAEVTESRIVGKEHLQVRLKMGHREEQGIGFGLAGTKPEIPIGTRVSAAFVPELDAYYPDRKRIRLRLKEVAPASKVMIDF